MTRRRSLLCACLAAFDALSLAACSTVSGNWQKAGASQEDYARDTYECERDRRMAGLGFLSGAGFYAQCMKAHGWQPAGGPS
jgi:predicted small secreted protein